MNHWKIGSLNLLAIFIIFANIVVGYFLFRQPESEPEVSLPSTSMPTITPSSSPTVDETNLIKQAVFAKTGLNETKAEITINQNTGQFAKGNIKEFEAVGGAYWLAAKTATGWVCIYDGQANPSCSQINPYNFPKDMAPECLDASGKVVKR